MYTFCDVPTLNRKSALTLWLFANLALVRVQYASFHVFVPPKLTVEAFVYAPLVESYCGWIKPPGES